MASRAKVTILQTGGGNVKGICLNSTSFHSDNKANPVCISPDENGLLNFEEGKNVHLETITNGVRISSTNTAEIGGTLPLIHVSDGRTLTINTRHVVFPFSSSDNYTLYLPELQSYADGTVIEIKCIGQGKYKIAQRDHQRINHFNSETTEGSSGYLQLRSGGTSNFIQLVLINGNELDPQTWYSFNYNGSFDTE